MILNGWLAFRRHVLVVILGQCHADEDVTFGGFPRLDAAAFLAAFDEQIVGVHPELALGLTLFVALHAAAFEDRFDDVCIDKLFGEPLFGHRRGVRPFAGLFLQAQQTADRIRRILGEVVLTAGD